MTQRTNLLSGKKMTAVLGGPRSLFDRGRPDSASAPSEYLNDA